MKSHFARIVMLQSLLTLSAGLWCAGSATLYAAALPCPYPLTPANRPVAPPMAPDDTASFTDPTAETQSENFVSVGHKVYIAPFARLEAQSATDNICIEDASNVQDNTLLKVNGGPIHLGHHAIIAHGAQLVGDGTEVSVAHKSPSCPLPSAARDPNTDRRPDPNLLATPKERGRQALANALADYEEMGGHHFQCGEIPGFMSFNSLNQSVIEDGALLGATARLTRGVVLRAGYSSYPGKSLNTQAEADTPGADLVRYKVRFVTAGDIAFMAGVLHVNESLAKGYTAQFRDQARLIHPFGGPESIYGIGIDPGSYHRQPFNNTSERPTIGYAPGADLTIRDATLAVADPNPGKNIRIIGDVRMVDIEKIQDFVSIRADEGEPMTFRSGVEFGFANTFHALEPVAEDPQREVRVRAGVKLEERVVVHGGGRLVRVGGPDAEPTEIDDNAYIGKDAVVFRSHVSENTRVGARAVLAGYDNGCDPDGNCTLGEQIPDGCVKLIDTPPNQCAYFVEW